MRIALAMVWSPFSSQSPSYITMSVMLSLQERFTLLFWVTLTITCSMCSIVAFRLRGTVGGGSVWAGLWSTLNLNAYLSKHNIFFYTAHCSILFRRNKQQMRNETTIKLLLFGVPENLTSFKNPEILQSVFEPMYFERECSWWEDCNTQPFTGPLVSCFMKSYCN